MFALKYVNYLKDNDKKQTNELVNTNAVSSFIQQFLFFFFFVSACTAHVFLLNLFFDKQNLLKTT